MSSTIKNNSPESMCPGISSKKPCTSGLYFFLSENSAKQVPRKYIHYRPARLIKGRRWYIEFYYKNGKGKFERFRIFENVNKFKDLEFSLDYVDTINKALQRGYNPFEQAAPEPEEMTITEAINFAIEKQKGKGLVKETIEKYEYAARLVINWTAANKLSDRSARDIQKKNIQSILEEYKDGGDKLSNRQYNNMKGYLSAIFAILVRSEVIEKNPVSLISSLKTKVTKHQYYDEKLFPKITAIIKENDKYLWYAVMWVYYLGVRSGKELRLMKVGDILDEGKYFRFRAEATKANRDDVLPIDPNLKVIIEEMNLLVADKKKYIFGVHKEPSFKPVNEEYFSNRFAKIRKDAGLSQSFTLYSYKHSRVVHLLRDGAKLSDVSKLMRHKDISVTAIYARDLGVDFDSKELEKLTRKI